MRQRKKRQLKKKKKKHLERVTNSNKGNSENGYKTGTNKEIDGEDTEIHKESLGNRLRDPLALERPSFLNDYVMMVEDFINQVSKF